MKKLAELSVRYFITFTMIYLAAVGVGGFAFTRLPIDMYPDITFPLVGVITQYVGASPEDVENLVSRPIEEAVSAVEGVEEVSSWSRHGISVVLIEFSWDTNLDIADMDVRRNLDFIDDMLPDDATDPISFAFNPSMQPILIMAVYGPYDQARLRQISTRTLEPRLERLHGVAQADTMGGLVREIQVRFDPDQLLARGITLDQVVGALRAENIQLPGGTVREGGRDLAIVTQGQFDSVDQIREVVVGVANRVPVRLRDVADVVDTFEDEDHIVRNNGRSAVLLTIRKQSDANTVETVRAVEAALPAILAAAPPGVQFGTIFDQSEFIRDSISNLSMTALLACLLTFLVLLAFLRDVRAAAVVGLSIPVSVVVTFLAMYALDITLNVISMAGLALAIGMLVDNSIVVLENIYRHQTELGKDPRRAAVEGTQEVAMAITASTLTTIAVFGPILFVEGVAGEMFWDMTVTICVSLTASLLVAVTLVPMLSSRMLKARASMTPRTLGYRRAMRFLKEFFVVAALAVSAVLAHLGDVSPPLIDGFLPPVAAWGVVVAVGWLVLLFLRWRVIVDPVSRFFEKGNDLLISSYRSLLGWCMANRWKTLVGFTLTFGASIGMMVFVPQDFFPEDDDSMIFFRIKAAVGSSPQQTDTYYRQAEKIVERVVPERRQVAVDVGTGEGFMALFGEGSHSGIVRLKLARLDERTRSADQIKEAIRHELEKVPGVTTNFEHPGGFGAGADVEVEIYGHDLDVARRVGLDVKAMLLADPELRDVQFSMDEGAPQLEVTLDRERMASLGINSLAVNRMVSTFFQGSTASVFREGADEFDIKVRAPAALRHSRREVTDLRLLTPLGKQVPLGTIARVDEVLGPVKITRKDQQRYVTVSGDSVGKNLGGVVERLTARLDAYRFPPDFSYRIGGTAEDMQESFGQLVWALLAAVLLVYMVMASQFESLLSPFIVFLTVPLTLFGIAAALLGTFTPLSIIAVIGVIMLAGVVVNNSIVLVDYANQRSEATGMTPTEAIIEAGPVRLRPILMTALTTILGMLPMAPGIGSGGQTWAPMARTVIGGLTWATFITLLFVPVVYAFMVRPKRPE
jgi:HAE1 family hydrophobic/amphiphilic exporter-1